SVLRVTESAHIHVNYTTDSLTLPYFFFLMTRRPPESTLFPTRRSSDLGMLEPGHGDDDDRWRTLHPRVRFLRGHDRETVRAGARSEEHTSELQSPYDLVCRLLLVKKNGCRSLLRCPSSTAVLPSELPCT